MDTVAKYRKGGSVIAATAVLLFSGYCLFYKLGTEPLQDYDEATYAEVTEESIAHGEPSSLTFLNTPYFRKPPLLFWMTTASSRVFRDIEFADRFPSALAGFAAILIVALVCIEAGGGVWTALAAAGILATTAAWMEFARDVRFDNLVAFCAIAAFYAAVRALRDSRWFVIVGIMLALGVLAKSVVGVFGGLSVLALLVYSKTWKDALRDRYLWFGAAISLLVLVPWHLYMTITYGAAFWQSYLGAEVLRRASTNLFLGGSNPTNGEYVAYLFRYAAPWFPLFAAVSVSGPFLAKRMPPRARVVFFSSLTTAAAVLAVAFAARTKAFGYLMPLYPFLAVAVALAGRELWARAASGARIDLRPALFAFAAILVTYAALFTRYEALHIDPLYGYEISQAYEERDVAAIIRSAPNPQVYAYGAYSDFGTILFYSRLPDAKNPTILLWSASSTPSASSTDFILTTSPRAQLVSAFPHYRFAQAYSGRFVSLFTVTAAASAAR